jgi:hypothetical protein
MRLKRRSAACCCLRRAIQVRILAARPSDGWSGEGSPLGTPFLALKFSSRVSNRWANCEKSADSVGTCPVKETSECRQRQHRKR